MEWDLFTRNKIEAYSRNTSGGNINKTFKYVYLNIGLVWPLSFWQGFLKTLSAMQETQEMRVLSLGWEYHLEEDMATHSSNLAGEIP